MYLPSIITNDFYNVFLRYVIAFFQIRLRLSRLEDPSHSSYRVWPLPPFWDTLRVIRMLPFPMGLSIVCAFPPDCSAGQVSRRIKGMWALSRSQHFVFCAERLKPANDSSISHNNGDLSPRITNICLTYN